LVQQAHDDLDVLGVPRTEGGLTLSVPGRILLMSLNRPPNPNQFRLLR
jgi:hypothetical protein